MKKILLLQTGGTIAMHFDENGNELDPDKWTDVLYKEMPELSKIAEIKIQNVFFEDSSDINKYHWNKLSEQIDKQFDEFDGFVILHGTDTMAYTASALSFALQNISKPVILTGSQVPMSNIRSDARRNLINAIELATYDIHEVAICFNDHLYRGNRSTKMSIGDFDAFASPNYPPLAEVGIHIELSADLLESHSLERKCYSDFDDAVQVIKIYPNLNPAFLEFFDLDQTKAVILEAFGSGNIPSKGEYNLLPFVEKCIHQNCHVMITSQAAYDSVDLTHYASGKALKKLGALSAGEMTMEATLTKTMNLLARNLSDSEFIDTFQQSIAGERS
ncbi:asparaginase [Rhodohalobacter sp. 614A]|uniref:asparaginase n=1 Tax=Rhodohalobacter sp. 614A TaxID=2908649 RepID=UPI001F42154E|nr:asparaginase [Rhodohalobacter sp. 614A]